MKESEEMPDECAPVDDEGNRIGLEDARMGIQKMTTRNNDGFLRTDCVVRAWSLKVTYDDGSEGNITEVPNDVAQVIDEWLP